MIDKEQDEKSTYLGLEPIPKLLLKQALPAAIGFMVMSMNMIVDTYFVGQFIGELAIGAISVVFPISFLFSSIGMSIGCLLYTSPSPRDSDQSRIPSSA